MSLTHQNISNILDDKPLVTPDGVFDVRIEGRVGTEPGMPDMQGVRVAVENSGPGIAPDDGRTLSPERVGDVVTYSSSMSAPELKRSRPKGSASGCGTPVASVCA